MRARSAVLLVVLLVAVVVVLMSGPCAGERAVTVGGDPVSGAETSSETTAEARRDRAREEVGTAAPADGTTASQEATTDTPWGGLRLIVWRSIDGASQQVEGAVVSLYAQDDDRDVARATTDAAGGATVRAKPGTYVVHVEKTGHQPWIHVLPVWGDQVMTYAVALAPGVLLRVHVVDAESERPLAGVRVDCEATGATWLGGRVRDETQNPRGVTDASGAYTFDSVACNTVARVLARAEGYAPGRAYVLARSSEAAEVVVQLARAVTIEGVVRDADGTPLDARVRLAPCGLPRGFRGAEFALDARTDDAGRFRFEGLPEGAAYQIRAQIGERTSPVVDVTAPARDVVVRFAPWTAVTFDVVEADGSPIDFTDDPSVVLHPVPWDGDPDDDDSVGIPPHRPVPLTQGRYVACVHSYDGPALREVPVEITAATATIRIELPAREDLVGQIVDPAGRPVDSGTALIRNVARPLVEFDVEIDDDGTFTFDGLPEGAWELTVDSGEFPLLRTRVTTPTTPLRLRLLQSATLVVVARAERSGERVRLDVDIPAVVTPDSPDGWENYAVEHGYDPVATFDGVPPGPVRLAAQVPGFLPWSTELHIEAGATHEVTVGPLVPAGRITETVRDATGAPVANAYVAVSASTDSGVTDATGRFAGPGLAPGTYTLTVAHGQFATTTRTVSVGSDPIDLDVTLRRGELVFLVVRNARGVPVAGAELQVTNRPDGAVVYQITTDFRGQSVLRLPPGTFRATLATGEATDFVVQEGATVDVTVTRR